MDKLIKKFENLSIDSIGELTDLFDNLNLTVEEKECVYYFLLSKKRCNVHGSIVPESKFVY